MKCFKKNTPLKYATKLVNMLLNMVIVINHFKSKNRKEKTVCTFKSKCHVEIKDTASKKRSPKKVLNIKKQGKPILLKELNTKIKNF